MKYQMTNPQKVKVMGMELDEWRYKSCVAHVAAEDSWATIYDIRSQQSGQGHATELLLQMKAYYEGQGKVFGGSVALNERMARLYKKCGIREYGDSDIEY